MDRWTTLEPVKLYQGSLPPTEKPSKATSSRTAAASQAHQNHAQFVGRLPSELHLLILHFLPIPDIPSYARMNRALSRLSSDERIWERRWKLLIGIETPDEPNARMRAEEKMNVLLDEIERRRAGTLRGRSNAYRNGATGHSRASSRGSVDLGSMGSPGRVRASGGGYAYASQHNRSSVPQAVLPVDDDFGEFAAADLAADEFDDFVGASPPTHYREEIWKFYTAVYFLLRIALIFPSSNIIHSPQCYQRSSKRKPRNLVRVLLAIKNPLQTSLHPSTTFIPNSPRLNTTICSPYIDTTDFLSGIMREKKKLENALGEEVAKGLNAGHQGVDEPDRTRRVEQDDWEGILSPRRHCPG